MSAPKPILCVGALTADLMMQVPDMPAAAGKYLARRAALVAAGMAASAATAVARLGHPVALWASAGDDLVGDFVVSELKRDGVDMRHVRRVPGAMSATAAILVDDRGERIVVPYYEDGLLDGPDDLPAFADFAAVLADVRWPKAAAIALEGAREAGIPAILDLDTGSKETLESLVSRADYVVASLAGAGVLTGADNAPVAVAALARLTSATIVVTAGEQGSYWSEKDVELVHRQPAFAVEAVDTNAAGDVFHGAFAVGMAEGMALADTMRFASAAAAIKCTRYGGRTGAPNRAEVEAFLKAEPDYFQ